MSFGKILLMLSVGLVISCTNNASDSHDNHAENDIPAAEQPTNNAEPIEPEASSIESKTSTTRSADSHTHGDAELAIVVEGGVVTIELNTPLYNLLGFEHAPETQAQETVVSRAEKRLGQGGDLFIFNDSADCEIKSSHQDVHLFEHDSEHNDHDDDHEQSDDSHERPKDAQDDDTHKDLILQYEFRCQQSSSLSNVSVNLFELFAELSEIDVTYLGPSTQRQVELTRNNFKMDLK